jgi:hypothetical protein
MALPFPLAPIQRSAWKKHSRKFISKILHSPAPILPALGQPSLPAAPLL